MENGEGGRADNEEKSTTATDAEKTRITYAQVTYNSFFLLFFSSSVLSPSDGPRKQKRVFCLLVACSSHFPEYRFMLRRLYPIACPSREEQNLNHQRLHSKLARETSLKKKLG